MSVKADFIFTEGGANLFIKGSNGAYTYDGTTLTKVSDADYPNPTVPGAAYLNGRFYVMTPAGDIYNSAEDDPTTWGTLDFANAEFEPDGGVAIARIGEYIVAYGFYTTELFWDAQNPTNSPLSPVVNGVKLIGCADGNTVRQVAEGLMWVGQAKAATGGAQRGRFVIAMDAQGTIQRVSTPDIDRILDADGWTVVYGECLTISGHMFYTVALEASGITLAYHVGAQKWYIWTKGLANASKTISTLTQVSGVATATITAHGLADGDPLTVTGANEAGYNVTANLTYVDANTVTYLVAAGTATPATGTPVAATWTQGPFAVLASAQLGNMLLVQMRDTGTIYEMNHTAVDDAGIIIDMLVRTGKIDGGTTKNKHQSSTEVIGEKVSTVAQVRTSDDDYATSSNYRQVTLSDERAILWRYGKFRRRSFDFRHAKSVIIGIEGLEIDLGGQDA